MAIHLKSLTISIFFSSLLLTQPAASDLGFTSISSCITPYNQSINNSNLIDTMFEMNIETLYSNLAYASNASSSLYSNSTAGESSSSGTAYGLYLCRGDVTSDACRACVKSLTDTLFSHSLMHSCKEGLTYMDTCMIHFANYSFFGKSNDAVSPLVLSRFTTSVLSYDWTAQGVLKGAINDAAFNSTTSFATREASTAGAAQETVYALAQCSPDLDKQTCSGCLNAALVAVFKIIPEPGTVTSAAALHASCQLRYSNVRFYGVSSVTSNSPAVFSAFLVPTCSFFLIHLLLGCPCLLAYFINCM